MHLKTHRLRTLLAIAALAAVSGTVAPAVAQERAELTESIESAREEREAARRDQLEAETALSLLEAEDEEVKAALASANELVASQSALVDSAQTRLDDVELDRFRAEADLAWATQDIDGLREALAFFAVESYVSVPSDDSRFLFESGDVNLAARRTALLSSIGRDATDALDDLRAAEEDRDDLAQQAEDSVALAEALESELSLELAELEEVQSVQVEISTEYDSRIAQIEADLDALESQEEELNELIRATQLELAGLDSGGAPGGESAQGFVKPTAGGYHSGFGPRLHPILGYVRSHNGLDIGGASGQPIWATKAGEVILTGWQGGYGNAVVVQHEGGLTSLYAHMSSISVSVGTKVDTGEMIGQVGSTGLSTGPHLHFEMRYNGNLIDPRPFLPS